VLELRSRRPELTLQAFQRGGDGDVRPHTIAPGQLALVHGVKHDLGQRVRPTLPWCPLVVGSMALAQGVDRRLERSSTLGVEHAVDDEHRTGLADVQPPPFEVLVGVFYEAIGIDHVPRDGGEVAQLSDVKGARIADPVFFNYSVSLLCQLLVEVADHRHRLITDLARPQCLCHLGQGLDLLPDTEPVGSRVARHEANVSHPADRRDVGAESPVLASLPRPIDDPAELELQPIDQRGKLLRIDLTVVQPLNLRHRKLVQDHVQSVQMFVVNVKS
jgi:hypothetical protein